MRVRLRQVLSVIPKQALKLALVGALVIVILLLLGAVAGRVLGDIVHSAGDGPRASSEVQYDSEAVPGSSGDELVSETYEKVLAFKEEVEQQEASMNAAGTILGQALRPVIDAIVLDATAQGDDRYLDMALELEQEFESVYGDQP